MTHSGNFGNIFGNGVFDLWFQGLFVEKCLVEDEPGVDPLGIEPLGVEVNLGVNLGNDMKESAEDADDFADGDDMELELFDRDVGLLQTLVIGDKRCLKSEIWNLFSNLVDWKHFWNSLSNLVNWLWPFSAIICHMFVHFSQNWGSDGHFEVLNWSEFWLVQKLWHKTQIFPFLFFWDLI